ncbi:SDR family NAD(P)-dependent oxidoreductase [Thermogemmatispora sp.]|uniref:SDR family NAD(P)-dependent oxidoreductase n=1 Tax=Thermogemmatispora sp. TaxID=1968838 RepID=UPI001DFAF2A4|nr:SDR family oxidoreductase [Thermogemmatispora sp.]MBX5449956.1 SDR family oxidoreductase [Thermogemmatispora sp.]
MSEGELFQGRSVVITGAARGLGRALALAFAARGAKVLVHYAHSKVAAHELVSQIINQGGQALALQADLRSTAQVEQLIAQAHAALGSFDVWINNAGASANTTETRGLSEEERFERLLQVDVLGTWRCCRAALPFMKSGSCILNIAWNHALDGASGFVSQVYATSKGAVIALSRCLARELAPRIRVNCIAPGWIENDWARSRSLGFRERVAERIPLGRWGQADDVVAAALFLASPAASFITGQVLIVDGGEVIGAF